MKMKKTREKMGDSWDIVLEKLIGKEVAIQYANGFIYEGTLNGTVGDLLILSNAKVIGSKNIALTDFLILRKNMICHLHLKGKVMKKE